jgi:hypothetical protein
VHKPEDARPEAVAQAGEIRAFMKAQKTKAILAVMAAIEAGDRQTVAAVLSAPAYLSGLDTRQAVAVRQLAERQFAPVESEQRAAVADLAERLVGAASSFAGHFKEMVAPPDPAVVAADARIGELANG